MILVDTTFLIDCLRKKQEIKSILAKYPDEILYTTEINIFELFLGLYSSKSLKKDPKLFEKRKRLIEELITKFQILSLARIEVIESAKILGSLIQTGQTIDFRDGLIGGIAKANGITRVLTKNKDHFKRMKAFKVISY